MPCLNGGTCDDQVNSSLCHCVAGYTGVNCATGKRSTRIPTGHNDDVVAKLKQS